MKDNRIWDTLLTAQNSLTWKDMHTRTHLHMHLQHTYTCVYTHTHTHTHRTWQHEATSVTDIRTWCWMYTCIGETIPQGYNEHIKQGTLQHSYIQLPLCPSNRAIGWQQHNPNMVRYVRYGSSNMRHATEWQAAGVWAMSENEGEGAGLLMFQHVCMCVCMCVYVYVCLWMYT